MSLVLYGGGVIDNRGSISGNTYSRSKFGATIRAKTSPVNVRNNNTTQARETLQSVTQTWRSALTEAQRQAWNAFALVNPRTNVFGNISYLSGMAWFTMLMVNMQNNGGAPYTAPPGTGSQVGLSTLSLTAVHGTPGTLTINYTHAVGAGSFDLHLFASPNVSPGISYANSILRDIGYVPLIASPGSNGIVTQWSTRFHAANVLLGKKIFVLAQVIDTTTGVQSPGIIASTIAT